jgi:hypothetical protein
MFKSLFARKPDEGFKTRSADRDLATDGATIGRVAEAIESALAALQAEQTGLSRRVEDAVAMASLAVGNESDEYVSREENKTDALRGYEDDMRRGRDRLRLLEQHVLNLRFLRAAFLTRFPPFNTKPLVREPTAPAAPTGNSGVG